MSYIATFYSHFGAIRFKKLCQQRGIPVKVMPVPRALSSSCGTCAEYEGDDPCPGGEYLPEVEQVVRLNGQGYQPVYGAEGS